MTSAMQDARRASFSFNGICFLIATRFRLSQRVRISALHVSTHAPARLPPTRIAAFHANARSTASRTCTSSRGAHESSDEATTANPHMAEASREPYGDKDCERDALPKGPPVEDGTSDTRVSDTHMRENEVSLNMTEIVCAWG